MKTSSVIARVVYFVFFSLILSIEYVMIEMREGSLIGHDDKRIIMLIIFLMAVVPIYLLYDIAFHDLLSRLIALLLQTVFNLWSMLWFATSTPLSVYEAEYNSSGIPIDGMIPASESNFNICWMLCGTVMVYLSLAMLASYLISIMARNKNKE